MDGNLPGSARRLEPADPRAAFDRLVEWETPESARRLERAGAKQAFFPLARYAQTQENTTFCGVASIVMILRALREQNPRFEKPVLHFLHDRAAEGWLGRDDSPYIRAYGQYNCWPVFGRVKSFDATLGKPERTRSGHWRSEPGLSLGELEGMLRETGLRTRRVVAERASDEDIRRDLVGALGTRGRHVLANYDRAELGQHGGGHFSPLGAYDEGSRSFLVMDVNPGRDWVWAPERHLFSALRSGGRGYVLVEEDPALSAASSSDLLLGAFPVPPLPFDRSPPAFDLLDATHEALSTELGPQPPPTPRPVPRPGRAGEIDVLRSRHRALLSDRSATVVELLDAADRERAWGEDLPLAVALARRAEVLGPPGREAVELREQCEAELDTARLWLDRFDRLTWQSDRAAFAEERARADSAGPYPFLALARRARREGLAEAAVALFARVESSFPLEPGLIAREHAEAAAHAGYMSLAERQYERALRAAPRDAGLILERAALRAELSRRTGAEAT